MPVYLKYGDTIKGNVKEPAHRGWIELESVQFNVGRPVSASVLMGGSSAKDRAATNLTEFLLIKKQDSASVHLIQASLAGQAATAIIDYTRADGSVYLELTMTETLISGYSVSGSGGKPTESISLNFTKVEFKNVGMGAGP